MEEELEKVNRRIREAGADLKRAKERDDRELELKINDRLNLLLEEKKQLTAGYRTETAQAVAGPTILFYEIILRNVDSSLTSLAEERGFRNFVKAQADIIGVTGFIQRYNAYDLKLHFEGSEHQCDDFLDWLKRMKSDYHMIGYFDPITDSEVRRRRYYDSFEKIDHASLETEGERRHSMPRSLF